MKILLITHRYFSYFRADITQSPGLFSCQEEAKKYLSSSVFVIPGHYSRLICGRTVYAKYWRGAQFFQGVLRAEFSFYVHTTLHLSLYCFRGGSVQLSSVFAVLALSNYRVCCKVLQCRDVLKYYLLSTHRKVKDCTAAGFIVEAKMTKVPLLTCTHTHKWMFSQAHSQPCREHFQSIFWKQLKLWNQSVLKCFPLIQKHVAKVL